MSDRRRQFRDDFEAEMAYWDVEVAKLGALARESGADAQLAFENGRQDFHARVEGAKRRREEFAEATDAAWEDAKAQLREAWRELEEQVKSAFSSSS